MLSITTRLTHMSYVILLQTVRCVIFFLFSSSRRHTRFSRDWSSDVCSSDLPSVGPGVGQSAGERIRCAPGSPGGSWSMWGLSLALLGGGLVLTWLKPLHAQLRHRDPVRCPVLASVGYSTVGALIVARRPDNAIGWIFRVMAVGFAGTMFSQEYAVRTIAIAPHSLPAVGWIGYQAGWLLLLGSAPIILVFAIRAAATAASTSSSVASRTSAWICAVAGLRSSRTG